MLRRCEFLKPGLTSKLGMGIGASNGQLNFIVWMSSSMLLYFIGIIREEELTYDVCLSKKRCHIDWMEKKKMFTSMTWTQCKKKEKKVST